MRLLRKAEWDRICRDINDIKTTSWELMSVNASLQADNENLRKKVNQLQRRLNKELTRRGASDGLSRGL